MNREAICKRLLVSKLEREDTKIESAVLTFGEDERVGKMVLTFATAGIEDSASIEVS